MKLLPRVSEFEYKGVHRVAIERGPDKRGCGLLCTQVVPEAGLRTFKPAKMLGIKRVGFFRSLYYLAKSARFEIG